MIKKSIVLPLGISFFTFQQIGFIVDAYQDKVGQVKFVDYCAFVTFFPQLVAGPIVSYDEILPQFGDIEKRKVDWGNIAKGLYAFSMGLGKKVLIADVLGNAVNLGMNNLQSIDVLSLMLVMLSYTMQIYFDFSGYSDMASGIALMLNIELPMNFDSPYKAVTIADFWKRWHMTLTRFLTRYIYLPIGGNRKGDVKTYVNILLVFLISGLWHGASWNFVLWGGLHGVAMVLTRAFERHVKKIHGVVSWIFTFIFVNFTWLIFRVTSLKEVKLILEGFVRLPEMDNVLLKSLMSQYVTPVVEFLRYFDTYGIIKSDSIITIIIFVFIFIIILACQNVQCRLVDFKPGVRNGIVCVLILYMSIISFASVSTFLYFNF